MDAKKKEAAESGKFEKKQSTMVSAGFFVKKSTISGCQLVRGRVGLVIWMRRKRSGTVLLRAW
jgi:hypothetical protein